MRGVAKEGRPRAGPVIVLAAAALFGLAPALHGAEPLRFKLELTRPMPADGYVKLASVRVDTRAGGA